MGELGEWIFQCVSPKKTIIDGPLVTPTFSF